MLYIVIIENYQMQIRNLSDFHHIITSIKLCYTKLFKRLQYIILLSDCRNAQIFLYSVYTFFYLCLLKIMTGICVFSFYIPRTNVRKSCFDYYDRLDLDDGGQQMRSLSSPPVGQGCPGTFSSRWHVRSPSCFQAGGISCHNACLKKGMLYHANLLNIRLAVWKLSGIPSRIEAFQKGEIPIRTSLKHVLDFYIPSLRHWLYIPYRDT